MSDDASTSATRDCECVGPTTPCQQPLQPKRPQPRQDAVDAEEEATSDRLAVGAVEVHVAAVPEAGISSLRQ